MPLPAARPPRLSAAACAAVPGASPAPPLAHLFFAPLQSTAGYAALAKNEFAGLTLVAPEGTPVTLSGPPASNTPHSGWSLGAVMGMQAGQYAAFWGVMWLALALTAWLRRL